MTSKKLTKANQVFISEYLKCFNGTEAYSRAYPSAKRDSARACAADLLANPIINGEIEARLEEVHMSADEALKHMADIARGDIGDFLNGYGGIDLDEARKRGLTKLIKKIKQRTVTKIGKGDKDEDTEVNETEIELYPADVALERVLKITGKFREQIDVTSGGEKINPYASMSDAELLAMLEKIVNANKSAS